MNSCRYCQKSGRFCRRDDREKCVCGKCQIHCNCQGPRIVPTLESLNGDRAICRGRNCGATIYWVKTEAGKLMPLNADGSPHWGSCPDVASFKRKRASK